LLEWRLSCSKRIEYLSLLAPEYLVILGLTAFAIGFVKAGIPALGMLVSALIAMVFTPREALGIILIYLLAGDLVAVCFYWRLAHVSEYLKMLPPTIIGIALGGIMLSFLNNDSRGLAIGLMVVVLVSLEPFRPKMEKWAFHYPHSVRYGSGLLAGVSTTIGNAAGPVMSLYFLLLKLDKKAFVGTSSIFFLTINTIKIPIFQYQGLFTPAYFPSIALSIPLVYVGAIVGRFFLNWISQLWFKRIILVLSGLAGLGLVIRYFV